MSRNRLAWHNFFSMLSFNLYLDFFFFFFLRIKVEEFEFSSALQVPKESFDADSCDAEVDELASTRSPIESNGKSTQFEESIE